MSSQIGERSESVGITARKSTGEEFHLSIDLTIKTLSEAYTLPEIIVARVRRGDFVSKVFSLVFDTSEGPLEDCTISSSARGLVFVLDRSWGEVAPKCVAYDVGIDCPDDCEVATGLVSIRIDYVIGSTRKTGTIAKDITCIVGT
jgi:hypothetical protein